MAPTFHFKGWKTWADWGSAYRVWVFEKDYDDLDAKKGYELCDHGPVDEDRRFSLRWKTGKGEKKMKNLDSSKVADTLFGGVIPPWRPPRPGEQAIEKSLNSVTDALKEVGRAIRSASTANDKLDAIKAVLDADPSKLKGLAKSNQGSKSNKYLRLKGEHEYDNGDPYTDFELLVDIPYIPVTRVDGLDPMHAAKGDVLRERYDGELTPFELRRGGRRIGDPEWWQLRHLFVGLKDSEPDDEHGDNSGSDRPPRDLRYLHRLSPDEPKRWTHVLRATQSIPGTIVQEGDFLTFSTGRHQRKDPDVHGAVALRVPRAQLPTIEEHFEEAVRVLHLQFNPKFSSPRKELRNLHSYLGRKPNPRWKDSTCPLIVIRPLIAPVSEPIEADNDDVALFELLYSVGGRMPHV